MTFEEVASAIRLAKLPACDAVVGIGSGGVVPASLIAYKLQSPLNIMWINYRSADNRPQYPTPHILQDFELSADVERILLVDDVVVTGKTLAIARAQFPDIDVITFALKGKADIVLFPELSECVQWPWHINSDRS